MVVDSDESSQTYFDISDGSEPRLGSGSAFFGGLGLDILRRAQS